MGAFYLKGADSTAASISFLLLVTYRNEMCKLRAIKNYVPNVLYKII